LGVKNIRDKFENTPLEYAIKRKSNQCVGALLNHAINETNSI
jgi:ankyrin repeat protein